MASLTSARLLAPEQFVQHIQTQFAIDLSKPYKGRTAALQRYLLPLGGLDHDTIYERDRQIKVQTLLAAQALSWEAAGRIIEKIKALGSLGNPDDPQWTAQLQDLVLKIQSRSARSSELDFFRERFRLLIARNANAAQAWTAVVYALLASVEFWSL